MLKEHHKEKVFVQFYGKFERFLRKKINLSEELVYIVNGVYRSKQHMMSCDLERAATLINRDLDNLSSYIQLGDHFFEDLLADDPSSEEIKLMYSKLDENAKLDLAMRSGEMQNIRGQGSFQNSLNLYRKFLSGDEVNRLLTYLRNDQVI
jgi:hypothetical protein